MTLKRASHALPVICNHSRKSCSNEVVSTIVPTPVKQEFTFEMEISITSTKGSTLTRFTVGSPGTMNLKKINFKELVSAEFEGDKEKYIKGFDGWLDY